MLLPTTAPALELAPPRPPLQPPPPPPPAAARAAATASRPAPPAASSAAAAAAPGPAPSTLVAFGGGGGGGNKRGRAAAAAPPPLLQPPPPPPPPPPPQQPWPLDDAEPVFGFHRDSERSYRHAAENLAAVQQRVTVRAALLQQRGLLCAEGYHFRQLLLPPRPPAAAGAVIFRVGMYNVGGINPKLDRGLAELLAQFDVCGLHELKVPTEGLAQLDAALAPAALVAASCSYSRAQGAQRGVSSGKIGWGVGAVARRGVLRRDAALQLDLADSEHVGRVLTLRLAAPSSCTLIVAHSWANGDRIWDEALLAHVRAVLRETPRVLLLIDLNRPIYSPLNPPSALQALREAGLVDAADGTAAALSPTYYGGERETWHGVCKIDFILVSAAMKQHVVPGSQHALRRGAMAGDHVPVCVDFRF